MVIIYKRIILFSSVAVTFCNFASAFAPLRTSFPAAHRNVSPFPSPKKRILPQTYFDLAHRKRSHSCLSAYSPDIDVAILAPVLNSGYDSFLSGILASERDPFQYAFMFPTMTLIAVLCQSAGIGGAALLSPLLLLIFPLLGPNYPLDSAASSIASALLTECFGFMSGLSGYWRRGLVDWNIAFKFLIFSVPASLAGALVEPSLASETTLLRGIYATLMITLCLYLLLAEKSNNLPEYCPVPPDDVDENGELEFDDSGFLFRSKTSSDGTKYTYLEPTLNWKTNSATLSGAGLTGLLGVGMGEVVLPQLIRIACMPLPVAAGTSVAIVVVTALTAASIQFVSLAQDLMATSAVAATATSELTTSAMETLVTLPDGLSGADIIDASISAATSDISMVQDIPHLTLSQALVQVVPWSLVQYTIPGAILGGQIAPWITANRILDDEAVEKAVAILFGVIGTAFAIKCVAG